MDAEPVADLLAVEIQWLRERRLRAGVKLTVTGNGEPKTRNMRLEVRDGPDASNGCV